MTGKQQELLSCLYFGWKLRTERIRHYFICIRRDDETLRIFNKSTVFSLITARLIEDPSYSVGYNPDHYVFRLTAGGEAAARLAGRRLGIGE